YYDWNVSSGDGSVCSADEIVQNSTTDKYHHVMILFHDAATKDTTVEALPRVIEYYKNLGYEFRAIDRESFVSHHKGTNERILELGECFRFIPLHVAKFVKYATDNSIFIR